GLILAALVLASVPTDALASRFGPPWLAEVIVERAVVRAGPDAEAEPIGPVDRGSRHIVLEHSRLENGVQWMRIEQGWLNLDDIDEVREPWVAEVVTASISIFSSPTARSAIRRTASRGSLLRVAGLSPGFQGDPGIWWATTEGYVTLEGLAQAKGEAAEAWKLPSATDAGRGWWGAIRSDANVRAGPAGTAPLLGQLHSGDRVKVLAEEEGTLADGSRLWYRIDGGRFAGGRVHSSLISRLPDPKPNTTAPEGASGGGTWLVVDRKATSLTVMTDGEVQFVTYVSLGRAGVETPIGLYSTFGKYLTDDMTSTSVADADREYDFPNVPFTQYYRTGGYAIHSAYWHDQFGGSASQGCVNVTWSDGAYLFDLTTPYVVPGNFVRWAEPDQSTPVVIVG
ncbi:MAG: L,D-transpeptidase family protein, partial [Chloroflexota bacterium]